MGLRVDEQVLRLDVAVAHAERVDVREGAAELVRVQLHVQQGEGLLALRVVARHPVHGLRHKVHHEVEVRLVGLVARVVEVVVQRRHVDVVEHLHDLQLAVLEALVLQHLLDRHLLPGLLHRRLVHHAERAVADDPLVEEGPRRRALGARRAGGGLAWGWRRGGVSALKNN